MHTYNGQKRYVRFLKLSLKLIFSMLFYSTKCLRECVCQIEQDYFNYQ